MKPQVKRRDRWFALGLLIICFVGLWLLVYLSWMKPMLEVDEHVRLLHERQQRSNALLAQEAELDSRLKAVEREFQGRPSFIPDDSAALASSRLVKKLEDAAAQANGEARSCVIIDRTPLPVDATARFTRVAVQVQLRCGMGEFMTMLHILESGVPRLYVESLVITSVRRKGAGQGLDVAFELSGYLRPSHTENEKRRNDSE